MSGGKGTTVDLEQLQLLMPDIDPAMLSRASSHSDARAALDDLRFVTSKLAQHEVEGRDRADWEITRVELVAEIRRLTLRLCSEP